MKFYDREKESEVLQLTQKQSLHSATFTVLMGRRRVDQPHRIRKYNIDDEAYL